MYLVFNYSYYIIQAGLDIKNTTGVVKYVIPIVVDKCRTDPCANGGTCSLDENFDKHCDCTPTFTGPNCEAGMKLDIY